MARKAKKAVKKIAKKAAKKKVRNPVIGWNLGGGSVTDWIKPPVRKRKK